MKRAALALCGATVLLLVSCQGGDGSTGVGTADRASTHVAIASSPTTPFAGDPVTVTVSADNEQLAITTVAIDFTADGTTDETQTFDAQAVTATFLHVYETTGDYEVRAVATDTSGAETETSVKVTVTREPPTIPVTWEVYGTSPQGGRCFAAGPPVTCPNCAVVIGTWDASVVTMSLGPQHHGAHVRVDQGFNQWPVAFNDQLYRCEFHMHILAGEPGQQRPIGNGACQTTSFTRPAMLNCRIAVAATVP